MFLHVKEATYLYNYVIRLKFNNGTEGDIDLKEELDGEVFEPLRDLNLFKDFRLDNDIDTIVWSNGADFAPEFLYDNMNIIA